MGLDALTQSQRARELVEEMCDLDKQTLIGTYKPFGAHAAAIYEWLKGNGLVDSLGFLTELGSAVSDEIQKDPYFAPKYWVDKPCDTE